MEEKLRKKNTKIEKHFATIQFQLANTNNNVLKPTAQYNSFHRLYPLQTKLLFSQSWSAGFMSQPIKTAKPIKPQENHNKNDNTQFYDRLFAQSVKYATQSTRVYLYKSDRSTLNIIIIGLIYAEEEQTRSF